MIAHDLRTPVTSIKGFSQLALRQKEMSPQLAQYLTTVVSEANRIATMVDDLVIVSGIEQGVVVPKRARVEVYPLLRALAGVSTSPDLPVEVATGPGSFVVLADPQMLERVFANLVRLALKYCRTGDSVQLGVERSKEELISWVAPHPSHVEDVYEDAGFPSETYHPRGMSSYIATQLVGALGGTLHTEAIAYGIRYEIRFPAAR
ncbi:MAG TPA: HAMP domain-containing sensor histidine kinase [Chloroflexota bacterium]|nr:HAMP domain-containing sensor histidine kinase [Chloroflexota bacterium]